MSDFRVLFFGAGGRATKAVAIEGISEAEAIRRLDSLSHPYPMELWQGLRRVRSFAPWGQPDDNIARLVPH